VLGITPDRSVIDVGGGASPLAARLLERGFRDVTVLDVSGQAISAARERLGSRAQEVRLLQEDVCSWRPDRHFDLWHDRAAFHFIVEADERRRYLETLDRALAPDGAVVIATFARDAPDRCSGLPVVRYDTRGLAAWLGRGFELVAERREEHRTPSGALQPFAWAAFRRRPRRKSANELLDEARGKIDRLTPAEALVAAQDGALIVDIRSDRDREATGVVPGSVHVPRTVLEWRLDSGSDWRNPHLGELGRKVVLLCDHGYSSSLAAATLVELGLNAADVIGGVEAWREAGLPVVPPTGRPGAGEAPGMSPPEPL
jgi:rhodanese-related sulfurtransferase